MGFGLSFGKKKQSSSGTSSIDKTTNLTGTQASDTTSSGSSTSATTGSTTGTTQGSTSQLGTQNQSSTGSTTGRTTGTTTSLGQDVQDSLASSVKSLLAGGINDSAMASLSNIISGNPDFDVDSFVADTLAGARNRGEQTLQESTSAFSSNVGGSAGTNSMAALIAARGRNDLEANLASIGAQARATGEGIRTQNQETKISAAQSLSGQAATLANALKGGTTTTDMTELSTQLQSLIGKTGTIGSSSETQQQDTSQSTATTQLLQELANVLTSQQQKETGTETQTTKGKSGGFGLSLGL